MDRKACAGAGERADVAETLLMIVMFGNNQTLLLAIVDSDLERIRQGLTLTYENPPHDAQLVKNIVIMHGKDKASVVELLRAGGVQLSEETETKYRRGDRTDRPRKPN